MFYLNAPSLALMRLMLRIVFNFVMLHIAVVMHGMPKICIVALINMNRIVVLMLHMPASSS